MLLLVVLDRLDVLLARGETVVRNSDGCVMNGIWLALDLVLASVVHDDTNLDA